MAESILDANEQQLAAAQGKITFLGTQTKPVATVVFAPQGREIEMARFVAVQGGRVYGNDALPYTKRFSVTPAELRRALGAVKPVLLGLDGSPRSVSVSFAIVTDAGGTEFRIPIDACAGFYRALIGALDRGNEAGREALHDQFAAAFPGVA